MKKNKMEVLGVIFIIFLFFIGNAIAVTRIISDSGDNIVFFIRNAKGNYWEVSGGNLQAAIWDLNNGSGFVWCPGNQTITISSTLHIGVDTIVDLGGSTLVPSSNIDVVRVHPGGQLRNGIINVSSVTGFTKSAIKFDGNDGYFNGLYIQFGGDDNHFGHPTTMVMNMVLISENGKGTAINFSSVGKGIRTTALYVVTVDNIRIHDFYYGILFYCKNGASGKISWANANFVSNIYIDGCIDSIYWSTDGYYNQADGNFLDSISVMLKSNVQSVLTCNREYNLFLPIITLNPNLYSGYTYYFPYPYGDGNIIDYLGGTYWSYAANTNRGTS